MLINLVTGRSCTHANQIAVDFFGRLARIESVADEGSF